MTRSRRAAAAVLTLGVWAGMTACGGEAEVCADVDALRADLDDLGDIEIEPGGLADFSAVLDQVATDVDQLLEDAESEYESEIDAVQTATQDLTASIKAATQAPSGAALTQVSTDFGAFTTAVDGLRDAVADTC